MCVCAFTQADSHYSYEADTSKGNCKGAIRTSGALIWEHSRHNCGCQGDEEPAAKQSRMDGFCAPAVKL